MKQSDARAAGRGRSVPPSFGREAEPEETKPEDFRIVGGQAFHLVLHVEVVPTAASMENLYLAVREATASGVLDGYAQAAAAMAGDGQADEKTPGGAYGGASSG